MIPYKHPIFNVCTVLIFGGNAIWSGATVLHGGSYWWLLVVIGFPIMAAIMIAVMRGVP